MSSLTFLKRVSLTAIAALGFGMISVNPAVSAVASQTLTIDSATDSIDLGESATAVLSHNFVNLGGAEDSVTLNAVVSTANASNATVYISVTDSFTSTANDATAANSPEINFGGSRGVNAVTRFLTSVYGSARDSITIAPSTAAVRNQGTTMQLKLYAPAAGTYTVQVFTRASDSGAAAVVTTPSVTWTVTVTAPSSTVDRGIAAVRHGTSALSTGLESADSSTLFSAYDAAATDTTPEATIWTKFYSAVATNSAKESFTVTVSGEAYVTTASTSLRPTSGNGVKVLTFAYPTAGTEVGARIWSTGTAGTATVTITTVGGLAVGTKTFTFSGAPTKLEVALQYKKTLQVAKATAETVVAAVSVKDAAGRAVIGYAPSIVSSNTQAVTGGTCADVVSGSTATRDGVYICNLNMGPTGTSGLTSTITARVADPESTAVSYLTTTFDVALGGSVSTVVLSLSNKGAFEPGAAMVVTATAKDASGNTPYDGQSGPSLRANKALGGSAAGSTITMNAYYDGVSTSETRSSNPRVMTAGDTLFAPAASGAFLISGLDASSLPITVTGTVGDDAATAAASAATDAALEAIDAANAATDAANLAAEAADAATVAAE